MQGQDGIVAIIGAGEQHFKLQSFKAFGHFIEFRLDIIFHAGVIFFEAHFQQSFRIFVLGHEGLILIHAGF